MVTHAYGFGLCGGVLSGQVTTARQLLLIQFRLLGHASLCVTLTVSELVGGVRGATGEHGVKCRCR
jgi:hypothetical protein